MSTDAAPAPTRHAPIALWRVAQAFLATLYNLFGGPEDVAADHTLTAKAHALLASWLRCAEAMLRRLLAIEAAHYPKPNAPPRSRPARQRARKLMHFTADKPEEWRVSFRVFISSPACGGSVSAHSAMTKGASAVPSDRCAITAPACGGGNRFRSAWPLAERYEALLRVFNDPTACARRLHAAPRRLHNALRAPPEAEHRVDDFDIMAHHAETAWRPHFSSG